MESSSQISISTPLNQPTFIEWNDKLENAAKNIGESAKGFKLMHIAEAQKAQKIYNRLMILGIFLGPLASFNAGFHDSFSSDIKTGMTVIGTVSGLLSGVVVAIIKFGKYDEESRINKQVAARYTSIESNVRRQLSLYRNDRIPASTYMEWLELKYEELFLSAPLLPPRAYDEYYNVSKKLGLNIPNRYETTITINNEFKNTSQDNITSVNINEPSSIVDNTNNLETSSVDNSVSSPQLDKYLDKMLQYEMSRLMR